jgi:type II restriction enzyme
LYPQVYRDILIKKCHKCQTISFLLIQKAVIDEIVRELRNSNELYLFDIKTAKPNIGELKGHKRKLLEWVAIRGVQDKTVTVKTLIAIPYNPYEPEPYQRWTLQGLFDIDNEIMVGNEFWDFIGGENTYEPLLAVFETTGLELCPEIDARFERFNR